MTEFVRIDMRELVAFGKAVKPGCYAVRVHGSAVFLSKEKPVRILVEISLFLFPKVC